jgi:hypothetical protein
MGYALCMTYTVAIVGNLSIENLHEVELCTAYSGNPGIVARQTRRGVRMDNGPQLRCTCRACQRARFWCDVRAATSVIGSALVVIAVLIGGCLFLAGCSHIQVSECENGYSWRGDCIQPLFKE